MSLRAPLATSAHATKHAFNYLPGSTCPMRINLMNACISHFYHVQLDGRGAFGDLRGIWGQLGGSLVYPGSCPACSNIFIASSPSMWLLWLALPLLSLSSSRF